MERTRMRMRMRSVFTPCGTVFALTPVQPARKKSKAEVMLEVIAKSKMHKVKHHPAERHAFLA